MSELTHDILKASLMWKYVEKTPANGQSYYNADADQIAIAYEGHISLYFNRKASCKGNFACCFANRRTIK